ncbi:MAG: ankyrin repeat domain-containing protein [Deltaproteobacteria bacterium]|nr:ankyrin repeat domain-containing protein [Deltaproteobacteria bacterium]
MRATERGDIKEMERLIAAGVDVNREGQNTEFGGATGFTALGKALEKGHVEAARLLIEKGADVNAKKGTRCASHFQRRGRKYAGLLRPYPVILC